MKKRFAVGVFVFFLLVSVFTGVSYASENEEIVILFENDVHCSVDGYAKLAALKEELSAVADYVGVVSSGDFVQGGSLGVVSKGEYIVNLMNLVGYDAITLGNHEFDYKIERLQELTNMLDATIVCSNFKKLEEDISVFEPYIIVSYGDTDIAYIGITTPDTITSSSPAQFKNEAGEYIYSFSGDNLYDTVQKNIDAAKKDGADYIIALSHLGSESVYEQWSVQTLIQNTTGLDVVLDGHSHSTIESMVVSDKEGDEVTVASTGTTFANIGKLTISDGEIKTELIPTEAYEKINDEVASYISQISEEYAKLGERKIGVSEVELTTLDESGNRIIRKAETNLGDLCADAYRVITGADIGMVNGGGIRTNIDIGDITFNEILGVFPFGNKTCVSEVTGQQVVDMLEYGLIAYPEENGSFQHVSGITFDFDPQIEHSIKLDENQEFVSIEGARRVSNVKVLDKETGEYMPIKLDGIYTLASHSYLLVEYGGGATMFKESKLLSDTGILDVELLENYITENLNGVVGAQYAESQNRINVLDDVLTRSQARDILLAAADDYNPGVTAKDILFGYPDGSLREENSVTRIQALVMLSRAFGDLPEPVGDSARWAVYPEFSDIPQWAQQEAENVLESGIVVGTEDGLLHPEEPLTKRQLELLIGRVFALFGSNLKDDFYATVNKTWLDSSVIFPGYIGNSITSEIELKNQQQLSQIIEEIVNEEQEDASKEDKIKTLYENILNWDARNAAGIDPIRPYLQAIDEAQTLDELMAAVNTVNNETVASLMLGFGYTIDRYDSSSKLLYFQTINSSLPYEYYSDEAVMEAYIQLISTRFKLIGSETYEHDAETLVKFYESLAYASLSEEEKADINLTYNVYTMDELQAMFSNVDLSAVLASSGLSRRETVIVGDSGLLQAVAALFTEENLELLKLAAKHSIIVELSSMLSHDFTDAYNAFDAALYGIESQTDEDVALGIVQSAFSDYLGQIYVERYFSAEAKADVENMIDDIIAVFSERIRSLDWMSETTKEKAIQKLSSITVNVGYPDEWDSTFDNVNLRSAQEGGSYFENQIALAKAYREKECGEFDEPMNWSQWFMTPYEVNAYYMPQANSINFPAGILQAPLYDLSADYTENLGGIGYTIAHEITHAFDNNGAQFDANGNQSDWWTQEDYAAFQQLCSEVIAFYDGVESIPGILCNGTLTIGENVADLGAIACITQLEGMEENPDYETLYLSVAQGWTGTMGRSGAEYYAIVDVHAPGKLRVNRVLQSMDEFYEIFDIKPGDGMYLPVEERVQIW